MTQPQDVLVWLQTTSRRDATRTINSIEESDIQKKYLVATDSADRKFPQDYRDLQQWWSDAWRDMISSAKARSCKYILRLEDDIIVNSHILHNICRWRALDSPSFGLGTLFTPDYWLRRPELLTPDKYTGATIRNVIDVEGGQAQLVPTDLAHRLLDGVALARHQKGLSQAKHQPSFDWSLSRSAWQLGLRVFVHQPALVNIHDGSLHSKIDFNQHKTGAPADRAAHYWGNKSFDPVWKAAG